MNITIINANPEILNKPFEAYLAQLMVQLANNGHQAKIYPLRDYQIQYCTGCFGCWVKTPGECLAADDSAVIRRAMIHSDFVLWAAPIQMGYPVALMKKMMDKCIPLIHPYFEIKNNEAHHRPRYDHYPLLGLLAEAEADTDEEDLRIIHDLCSRMALNMKTRLSFSMLTKKPVEGVAAAIQQAPATKTTLPADMKATTGQTINPPRHLTIFNGSPRGPKGNTPILFNHFLDGFSTIGEGRSHEMIHLYRTKDTDQFVEAFSRAECVLIGFPLYTDAMPGVVKAFYDSLDAVRGRQNNPPVGFLVQSGFPEAAHSRFIEQYLQKLAGRLGCPYIGTIVKGAVEGIKIMPPNMTRKLFQGMFDIGKIFGQTGGFDPVLLSKLAKPEKYPAWSEPFFRLFIKLPFANFYWDQQLKQNGVYAQRFAAPYRE